VILLGLRLIISGGREAVIRLVVLAIAVGLGVGLLLTAISGINAVNNQNGRYAWLDTTATAHSPAPERHDPLWGRVTDDGFDGRTVIRVDVAATGPTSPVPPGVPRDPGPGQYFVSPALSKLLASTARDELGARYPGHQVGLIGDAALPAPNSLIIIVGRTPAQMAHLAGAGEVTSINTTPSSGCNGFNCAVKSGINASGIDLILSVAALALLAPVLIFIATATRLSAARREQRFAAMRLTGATPRQISVIAAVESTVAAAAGAAVGFGIFFALRDPVAAIPFTGVPFFPSELSLSLPDILGVALGVPAAAALAARLALHRVNVSPLGVTRRITPKAPRAWRVLPLLIGLAELGFFVGYGRPQSISGQILAFVPGLGLVMLGLVIAGPWLTMAGARLLARRASRPAALIAARRLADDPRAGFRAVSGLVLALFVTTVAVALITTENVKRPESVGGLAATNVLSDQFIYGQDGSLASGSAGAGTAPRFASASPPSAPVLARLRAIRGVQGLVEVRVDPGLTLPAALPGTPYGYPKGFPAGLVSCAQLATAPSLGRCPAGAAAVAFPVILGSGRDLAGYTWPAVAVPARQSAGAGVYSIYVATNGSVPAVEQARTVLENAYPAVHATPSTFGETTATQQQVFNDYAQLADVVILVSLPIAGCTLAASVAAGLTDRKRPFSLLRLTGAPLAMLRRVVALESAVPLLAVAAVSIGAGFAASAMFTTVQLQHALVAPEDAYYLMTAAGIAASLGIVAATFPLLRRITGPEVARND
jgi:FtsX-like permease family protein